MNYNINISVEGLDAVQKKLIKIENLFYDVKFKVFLLNKCKIERDRICQTKLTGLRDKDPDAISDYINGMYVEITDEYIELGNNSIIDINRKNLSSKKRANYPAKLSLAKIIEYGIGYTGWTNPLPIEVDWQYDVNDHGYKGWYFVDKSGNVHWTNGWQGRLIFYELKNAIIDNISEWIYEYLDRNI